MTRICVAVALSLLLGVSALPFGVRVSAQGPLPADHPPMGTPGGAQPGGTMPSDHPPMSMPSPGPVIPGSGPMPADHPPIGTAPAAPSGEALPADHPPLGPADVIERAQQAEPEPMIPEMHRAVGRGPELSAASPSAELPEGTIRVNIVDEAGRPVPGAMVRIGVMQQGGARDAHQGKTDGEGRYLVSGLATGSRQAYRVSLDHEGARYSAMPFRLQSGKGMEVHIVRVPTTRDDSRLLMVMGQTFIEFRENRLHITQEIALANVGGETIVYPEGGGKVIGMPEGFVGFETEQGMGDQRLVPGEKEIRLKGSIPPGRVSLSYTYDLPASEGRMTIAIPIAFPTVSYRVVSEAPDGMQLEAEGFGRSQRHAFQGRSILATELNRKPTDPPFTTLRLTLRGLPGPGPLRWIAAALALLLGGLGLVFLLKPPRPEELGRLLETRRNELLSEATALAKDFERGDVGPKYHARRSEEIKTELAALLRREALAAPSKS